MGKLQIFRLQVINKITNFVLDLTPSGVSLIQ